MATVKLSTAMQGKACFILNPSHSRVRAKLSNSAPSPVLGNALLHQHISPLASSVPTTNSRYSLSTIHPYQRRHPTNPTKITSLQMGFNRLPPSPKGPFDDIQSILPTIGTGILVALFFASPLGGAFFAVFNSLFVLAFVTPFILFAGFQIWSALYTVEAPCPSCAGPIPVKAIKNEARDPTVCLNCGAMSRVNEKGDGLELCNNPYDMMDDRGVASSMFDQLFGSMGSMGGGMDGMSDFDGVVGDVSGVGSNKESKEDQVKKAKRQGTIIDVDVERDD